MNTTLFRNLNFVSKNIFETIKIRRNFDNQSIRFGLIGISMNIHILKAIIDILAEKLNFRPNITYFSKFNLMSNPNQNIEQLENRTIDVTDGYCNALRETYEFGEFYYIVNLVVVFNPRKRMTLNDIIFLPVSTSSSVLAWFILLVSIALIFLDTYYRFGKSDILNDAMNVLQSQLNLPFPLSKKSGKTTKIVLFVLLFVGMQFRSIHQGFIYKALTTNWIAERPRNFDDIDGSYVICVPAIFFDKNFARNFFKSFSTKKFKPVMVKPDYPRLVAELKKQPYNHGLLLDQFHMRTLIQEGLLSPRSHVLKGYFLNIPKCLYFRRNSDIKGAYDYYNSLLKATGILSKIHNDNKLLIKKERVYPEEISMKNSNQIFMVHAYGLFSGLIVLVFEILYFRLKNKKK